jgi:hypothetical protein
MVSGAQAQGIIASLIKQGEGLDTRDMTVTYAWIYSSYIALEPFPDEHSKFCERCLDSFDPPRKRFKVALLLLRSALKKAEAGLVVQEDAISANYTMLLERVFPNG